MKADWMKQLKQDFGNALVEGYPLSSLTTLKVGGPARGFLTVTTFEELKRVHTILKDTRTPLLLIGKGANLIIPDEGFSGLVIQLKGEFEMIRIIRRKHHALDVQAGAGCTLSKLLTFAFREGLSGLEPFIGIPATIGGAVRMNAGIPGASISDILTSVTYLTPEGTTRNLTRDHLHPVYRDMRLPEGAIVLKATFRLTPTQKDEIRERLKEFQSKRSGQAWQHYPNAGSIFKNPPGDAAGRLIEASGLKGYRLGDAQISPDHANIILNLGHATASEVINLITTVRQEVLKKTGVTLELEVTIARN